MDSTARPGLSPSRANDFLQCPLLFRFRVLDRLPEPPSPAAARGTLVHAVLQHLFDRPAGQRTAAVAHELVPQCWEEVLAQDPDCAQLDSTAIRAEADLLLDTYFTLEDPNLLEPADRELEVRGELDGLQLRGVIDRVDVAPDGAVRIVDYKTGRAPQPGFEGSALFQLRFYAVVLAQLRGSTPAMLQLIYLGDGTVLRHRPSAAELTTTRRRIQAIWEAIRTAARNGDWRPRSGPLCAWCPHQGFCPAFGGSPPELDPERLAGILGTAADGPEAPLES